MSDYISREEAIEKLAQYMISVTKQFNMTALPYAVYESRARSVLKDIPGRQIETIPDGINGDVIELRPIYGIRCAECMFYANAPFADYCKWHEVETVKNNYCGWGARRESEE